MPTIKELIEPKQEEVDLVELFREHFTEGDWNYVSYRSSGDMSDVVLDGGFDLEMLKDNILNWHKQSLKQILESLCEREEQSKNARIFINGESSKASKFKTTGYHQAKFDTISNIKNIIKELE